MSCNLKVVFLALVRMVEYISGERLEVSCGHLLQLHETQYCITNESGNGAKSDNAQTLQQSIFKILSVRLPSKQSETKESCRVVG